MIVKGLILHLLSGAPRCQRNPGPQLAANPKVSEVGGGGGMSFSVLTVPVCLLGFLLVFEPFAREGAASWENGVRVPSPLFSLWGKGTPPIHP